MYIGNVIVLLKSYNNFTQRMTMRRLPSKSTIMDAHGYPNIRINPYPDISG